MLATLFSAGLLMALIALSGSATLLLSRRTLERILLPLVAFAAGSLLGGAFLHLMPAALLAGMTPRAAGLGTAAGFALFLVLEHALHWHHCHRAAVPCRQPLTYLILVGDGLHNFLGGLAVGTAFLADIRVGWAAWLAAAMHEVPQELGDFGVLLHGGWSRGRALLFNFLSGATFLVGMLLAYAVATRLDVTWLMAVAAGNFIYIGAADLVPELTRHAGRRPDIVPLVAFGIGLGLMFMLLAHQG